MKGKEWYQAADVAEEYEDKRFSRGGRLIDRREKEAVLDALGPIDGKNVLEIACGTGRFSVLLGDRGANVVGLDISPAMLAQGREKVHRLGTADRVEFIRGDASRLPFPDDHFDAVLAMRFFHLAPKPSTFLSEMGRVAREQVVFDTFNRYSTRTIYNWLLPMGSRLYSRAEVEDLIESAGLELAGEEHDFILPYGLYRSIPGGVARALRRIDTTLGRTAIGDELASVSYWDTRIPE